jgi:hypothetical protein
MPASRQAPSTPHHLLGSHILKTLFFAPLVTERVQVAKKIWEEFKDTTTAWFDHAESGNKQITVMYTKGKPILMNKSTPPWEAGSMPPPFMIKIQEEAKAKGAGLDRHGSGQRGQGHRGR